MPKKEPHIAGVFVAVNTRMHTFYQIYFLTHGGRNVTLRRSSLRKKQENGKIIFSVEKNANRDV